jgi:hypothetical protein
VFELFVLDLNESIELACADSSEAAEPTATDHGVDDDGSTSYHN